MTKSLVNYSKGEEETFLLILLSRVGKKKRMEEGGTFAFYYDIALMRLAQSSSSLVSDGFGAFLVC